jgi:hypothetical protein
MAEPIEAVSVEENKENVDPQAMSIKEVEAAVEAADPPVEEPPIETPQPKRKGRPMGAKTCEEKRGKPRAPRKPRIVEAPVEVIPDERPRVIPDSRPIPSDNEMILELLRQQANARKNRKQALWKSWFS